MTDPAQPVPLDVRPCGRYEWERLVRRIVMPQPLKLLAFVLSTYADADGSRVKPGQDTLAAVTGKSDRTVRRLMTILQEDLGLLKQVSRGGGRGGSGVPAVYRLTVPVDLLDRVQLLPPSERPDIQVSGQSKESPDTQVSGQREQSPVDNSDSPDVQMSPENNFHRTSDTVAELMTGHSEPIDRTPGCPTTTHYQPPKDDQPPTGLPTQPETARGEGEEPEADRGESDGARASPPRCVHNLAVRLRHDGAPSCVFCRREAATKEAS